MSAVDSATRWGRLPALTRSRRILACARARARRWRRELGGGVRQHPGSNNCVEGAYGIARFDRREPVESDEHARSTCGVRELRQPPVRRSEGQRAAAARRPTSIVCWWRSFVGGERAMLAAPRIGAAPAPACAGDDGPARRRARPTRHSPPHGDIRAAACAANTTLAATRRRPPDPKLPIQIGAVVVQFAPRTWKRGKAVALKRSNQNIVQRNMAQIV